VFTYSGSVDLLQEQINMANITKVNINKSRFIFPRFVTSF
jgi:hypothetical protein